MLTSYCRHERREAATAVEASLVPANGSTLKARAATSIVQVSARRGYAATGCYGFGAIAARRTHAQSGTLPPSLAIHPRTLFGCARRHAASLR